MTKEQEVIEYFEKQIEICSENAEICDDNNFDEEATHLRKQRNMFETVLSMLKEKDKTIAKYEKIYKEYDCYRWVKELDKKDKIIDLYIDELTRNEFDSCCQECCRECEKDKDALKHCIKQYFERKSEEC